MLQGYLGKDKIIRFMNCGYKYEAIKKLNLSQSYQVYMYYLCHKLGGGHVDEKN